jgi:hypothetical protein
MKNVRQKTILPILLGIALFGGTAFFYAPEDAQAMPTTQAEQFTPESVFTPQ